MFTPGYTGLALLGNSLGLTALPVRDSHPLRSDVPVSSSHALSATAGSTPRNVNAPVWATPCSLAATYGISVDFFSSGY